MDKTRSLRDYTAGDAAVEGLINGILAGIVMAVVVVGIETLAGASPLAALAYFAVSNDASPFLGLFTHIAVSGIYGVIFGVTTMMIAKQLGTRRNLGLWLVLGAVYGCSFWASPKALSCPAPPRPCAIYLSGHLALPTCSMASSWLG